MGRDPRRDREPRPGADSAEVLRHLDACALCASVRERVESLGALLGARRGLPALSRRLREATLSRLRSEAPPTHGSALRQVWAVPAQPVELPVLRGAPGEPAAWKLFLADEHRIAVSVLHRGGRRVLRGQVVPGSGELPRLRELHVPGVEEPIAVDEFGEFVLDPVPPNVEDLTLRLDDVIVRLCLGA